MPLAINAADVEKDPILLDGSDTCDGYKTFRRLTKAKMRVLLEDGWTLVIGNDYRLGERPIWVRYDCRKVTQTNGRQHGKCVRTVWAVRIRHRHEAPTEPYSILD